MDEYTADPLQTEKEAQRVLRKMKIDNAKAEDFINSIQK